MSSSCMYTEWLPNEEVQVTEDNEDKKKKKEYRHVPHKDKPAQAVAKRNARERRRVQAVNSAFARLRKVVPVENARGKRISKVKTLQYAIDYIQSLVSLLEQDRTYHVPPPHYHFSIQLQSHYYTHKDDDLFHDFNFGDEL